MNAMQLAVENMNLKRCPFCGGKVSLQLCDDEGNPHTLDYLDKPYSGVAWRIFHDQKRPCPIQYLCEISKIYDSVDEAIGDWNTRYRERKGGVK